MIMNINGEQVAELVNGIQSSGMHFVKWNGTDSNNTKVANGIYFYKMTAGKFIEIKRLVLLN